MRLTLCTFLAILFCSTIQAQNFEISGNVQDKDSGFPIPGVNIFIKNSSQGVVSDFDGNFKINNVPNGSTLVFSYVGYLTFEVVIRNNNVLNIK